MLTRIRIRNFKRFDDVEVELGNPAVFVGPNNSGKTTVLQALALWRLAVQKWVRPGNGDRALLNRRDVTAAPVPAAKYLWRDLQTDVRQTIKIQVSGVAAGREWTSEIWFYYTNAESIWFAPEPYEDPIMPVESASLPVAYLPPLDGLAQQEYLKHPGEVALRLGEGRTSEVARNLCYKLANDSDPKGFWKKVCDDMKEGFGVTFEEPELDETAQLSLHYTDSSGNRLELISAGRGLQQQLLLLTYLHLNPGAVILLDEPDAHLEILRQREIFSLFTQRARELGSQLVIATHSEVLMNQAFEFDDAKLVAFVGTPHPLLKKDNVRRALAEVRFDQYLLAEERGWVLYLEDHTDLSILQAFAERLDHPARSALGMPFLHSVGNQPNKARIHFAALNEAYPALRGFLLVDRDAPGLQSRPDLSEHKWRRREIENYLCQPETLLAWAESRGHREDMDIALRGRLGRDVLNDPLDAFWVNTKASDDFLDPLFRSFFDRLGQGIDFRKSHYHELVRYIPESLIDPEVTAVLDTITEVATRAI